MEKKRKLEKGKGKMGKARERQVAESDKGTVEIGNGGDKSSVL